MTGQLKEVFGIYANDRRQQGRGKPFIVVMTEAAKRVKRIKYIVAGNKAGKDKKGRIHTDGDCDRVRQRYVPL